MSKFYINDIEMYGLKSVPNIANYNKTNSIKNYICTQKGYTVGVYQCNDLIFGFYYNNETDDDLLPEQVDSSFKIARKHEMSQNDVECKLEFDDGTYIIWTSKIDTKLKKYNLDGIIEFDIISIPISDTMKGGGEQCE